MRGGYSPITASSGAEALKKSREFKGDIDLLLTDLLPDMDGFALAEQFVAARPRIRVLMMSGDVRTWNSPAHLLRKPFRSAELLDEVERILNDNLPSSLEVLLSPAEDVLSIDSVQATLRQELDAARGSYLESCREWLQRKSVRATFVKYQRARERLDDYVVQKSTAGHEAECG